MIHHLHLTLERHFRSLVPLPPAIDVSFATPDKRWGAARTKPTVNLFLWSVTKDPRANQSGVHEVREPDGRVRRLVPGPEVALRYLVTTWAGEPADEHQLLGALLRAALLQDTIEDEAIIHEDLPILGPVYLGIGSGENRPNDFWNSLDGQLKPNLELSVRFFVDLDREIPVEPAVTSAGVSVGRGGAVAPAPPRSSIVPDPAPGGLVRRRRGNAVVTAVEGSTETDPGTDGG